MEVPADRVTRTAAMEARLTAGFTSRDVLRRDLEERSDGRLHLDPENG